ncbi:RagB/SusD family nutrient uptake outer membrane protein [Sediminitomix flava]|uniref:Putative outer membrane starch-binding protein n=1 Tax=Sediminitomix flava TaxID=379075 RepID=A0A315Z2X9_SEDFL|nr:RagB/SusD family nutrient uptake outer membrane protein [Sediminitomix flava]PWJ36156.1 putative outer membrane starch-binding protein [Sediminitomix flava]
MKLKSIYVGLSLFCAVGATSCSDFLEIDPKDQVTSESFYKTPDDAYKALIGIYEKLRSDYNVTYIPMGLNSGVMSDDMYTGGGGASDMLAWQRMARFESSPATNDVAMQLWSKCFTGIQRANSLIQKYDEIEFKVSEEGIKNNYLGEARFLRAHYYFELARFFENIPLIEEPYIDESWRDAIQATPEELYGFITAEMIASIDLMSEAYDAEGTRLVDEGRLSKYAAMAELAKVYAFYTGYYNTADLPVRSTEENGSKTSFSLDEALAMTQTIITNSGSSLEANYADLFGANGDNSQEVLFEIPFTATGSGDWGDTSLGNMFCQMAGPRGYSSGLLKEGWGFGTPTRSLEAEFEVGDSRKSATIVYAKELLDIQQAEGTAPSLAPNYNYTSMFNMKYTTHSDAFYDVNSALNWGINYHYIRLADVILLAAEFELAKGNVSGATDYVNQVRSRAGLAGVASVDLDAIYHERRVELAFEGHRYFDLLRRGLDYAKSKIDVTNYSLTAPTENGGIYVNSDNQNLTGDLGDPSTFEVNFDLSKKGFLPIPQSEIDLNSNLKQNAGY